MGDEKKPPSDPGVPIRDAQDAFPNCPAGGPQPCPTATTNPCVKEIKATTGGTQKGRSGKGFDNAFKNFAEFRKLSTRPERPDNVLTPSSSSDKSLVANPPVVLVRGCKDVKLEAVTTPPDTPVKWKVEATETANKLPVITASGVKATLKTNVEGAFSVIATLGGCKVVWNVVFVWVKVDLKGSQISKRDTYRNNSSAKSRFTEFESGDPERGKAPWEATVKVTLIGGGQDKKLGIDKVKLHVLQNETADTLTGNYERGTATTLVVPGFPAVDSNTDDDLANPFMDFPGKVTPDNDKSAERTLWTADDPSGGFPNVHGGTKTILRSVSGGQTFRTAIASVSDDAKNTIMVHATATWSVDFSGTIEVDREDPRVPGDYTPTRAKTRGSDNFVAVPGDGQDAGIAEFQTFLPNARSAIPREVQ